VHVAWGLQTRSTRPGKRISSYHTRLLGHMGGLGGSSARRQPLLLRGAVEERITLERSHIHSHVLAKRAWEGTVQGCSAFDSLPMQIVEERSRGADYKPCKGKCPSQRVRVDLDNMESCS
ncbi:unnamed protein product, partial [Pleuronectes platessa]